MTAIVGDILDESAQTEYVNETDPAVSKALEILDEGKAFPVLEKK